jgi:hypothetical protein
MAITPTVHWLEYLDVAGAILAEPNIAVDGTMKAKGPDSALTGTNTRLRVSQLAGADLNEGRARHAGCFNRLPL